MDDTWFWANAVPPLVGLKSYYQLTLDAQNGGKPLGKAGDNNLFVCPMAGPAETLSSSDFVNPDGTFLIWGNVPGSTPQYIDSNMQGAPASMEAFWCYVMNSKINNSTTSPKISTMLPNSEVPLLVEKATQAGEINLPNKNNVALSRCKCTFNRFTSRHNKGGFLLFCDGHVGFFTQAEISIATPTATNPAYNIAGKVTWDPFQTPSRYGP